METHSLHVGNHNNFDNSYETQEITINVVIERGKAKINREVSLQHHKKCPDFDTVPDGEPRIFRQTIYLTEDEVIFLKKIL
jgi:hypothetical protein